MKEHSFGFIGDRCNEKQKGFSRCRDNGRIMHRRGLLIGGNYGLRKINVGK